MVSSCVHACDGRRYATPIAISYFSTRQLQNIVVVSPDAGGVARAKMFREGLEASGMRASLAMIIPRTAPEHGDDEEEQARKHERPNKGHESAYHVCSALL